MVTYHIEVMKNDHTSQYLVTAKDVNALRKKIYNYYMDKGGYYHVKMHVYNPQSKKNGVTTLKLIGKVSFNKGVRWKSPHSPYSDYNVIQPNGSLGQNAVLIRRG